MRRFFSFNALKSQNICYHFVTLSDISLLNLNYKALDILSNSMSQRVSLRYLKEIYQSLANDMQSLHCPSKMSAPHLARLAHKWSQSMQRILYYMQKRIAVNSAYINRKTKYYFIQYNAPYKIHMQQKRLPINTMTILYISNLNSVLYCILCRSYMGMRRMFSSVDHEQYFFL